MCQAASDFSPPFPVLSPSFPYLRGTDAPVHNHAGESARSPSRPQCSWQSTGGKMMFCKNTEIICTDLIKLERGTDRKRKDGSERHCLGVASLLFILSKHSIILIPPSPTVAGQQQGSGKQHDPEPARGMQTWQGSAWRIRQHLGEVSPAIPRQAQAKHPTTHTRYQC